MKRFIITILQDVEKGIEYSHYTQGAFTENQRRAIEHICNWAGKDPVPPADRGYREAPDPILHTAEMAKLTAEINERGLAAAPLGGQSCFDTGFDNGRDHPPTLSPGEAVDSGTKRLIARQQGFTGDTCSRCGGSSMKRNGACLCCADCGETTGCS
jgi:hypothetical protein